MTTIDILDYQPQYQPYFESFNKAWLEEYFRVEPIDEWVLGHPEEAILKEGGKIYFARYNGSIVGTVALKKLAPAEFELTKMAVDRNSRGMGIGKALCEAVIEKAKAIAPCKIILYSHTSLLPALHIYRILGFREAPIESNKYKRADIMMELQLESQNTSL